MFPALMPIGRRAVLPNGRIAREFVRRHDETSVSSWTVPQAGH
jgi:hypothetical protein